MFSKILLIFLFLSTLSFGALLSREDRICDPMRNNMLPYTGFRLHRQYSFTLPPFKHYMRLSHCAAGKVNFEAYAPIERNTGMAWAINMCGFTGPQGVPVVGKREKALKKARLKKAEQGGSGSSSSGPRTGPGAGGELKHEGRRDRIEHLFRAIEMATTKNEGYANATVEIATQLAAQDSLLPQDNTPGQWCYRAIRHRKFALRDVAVYSPGSFVGGLFMCPIGIPCTNQNTIPVMPLHSDDFAGQWFEIESMIHSNPVYKEAGSWFTSSSNFFAKLASFVTRKRHLIQRVPCFWTKPKYAHRHEKYMAPGGEWPEWAAGLDVNEAYVYTRRDLGLLKRAYTQSLNVMARYVSISAHSLPWERSILDQLKRDGEIYHKKPVHDVTADNPEGIGHPRAQDPQFELERDILMALGALKFSHTQILKTLADFQKPFAELRLSQRLASITNSTKIS